MTDSHLKPEKPASGVAKATVLWATRRVALGATMGAVLLALCFCADLWLLHSTYYVEWLVAAAAAFCLLLAWILHLREDGFMGKSAKPMRGAKILLVSAALFLVLSTLVLFYLLGFGSSIQG